VAVSIDRGGRKRAYTVAVFLSFQFLPETRPLLDTAKGAVVVEVEAILSTFYGGPSTIYLLLGFCFQDILFPKYSVANLSSGQSFVRMSRYEASHYALKSCQAPLLSPSPQHFAVMHQPPAEPVVYSMETVDEVVSALASFVTKAQKEAIDKRGRFTIALSGGSLPKMLRGLVNVPSIQWDKW
jgi:hypothetical protein